MEEREGREEARLIKSLQIVRAKQQPSPIALRELSKVCLAACVDQSLPPPLSHSLSLSFSLSHCFFSFSFYLGQFAIYKCNAKIEETPVGLIKGLRQVRVERLQFCR
jgi:hypothetical protein